MPRGRGRDDGRALTVCEEDEHGCSQESEEIQIEKEGKGRVEKDSGEALRPEEIRIEEESRTEKESRGEEKNRTCPEDLSTNEIGAKEIRPKDTAGSEARAHDARACPRSRRADPGHLSPVQPAGWRRQFG